MKKIKVLFCVFLSLISIVLLSSCFEDTPKETTRVVVDMSDREVVVPTKVTSYIDIWYSHQSIPAMLDKCEAMGATSYTKDNPSCAWFFEAFPNVQSAPIEEMNAEQILENGYQVVFMQLSKKRDLAEELTNLGIAAIDVEFNSYESMMKSISLVADVLNTNEARDVASKFNKALTDKLAFLNEKTKAIPTENRPVILNLRSFAQLRADGSNSVADSWIYACGGINVCETKGQSGNVYINEEQLLEWNPDIIFTSDIGESAEALVNPNYQSLKAVQSNSVYDNPSGIGSWNRYTSESLLQLDWASKIFYPEIFAETDMVENIKSFYKDYYDYNISDQNVERMLKGLTPIDYQE